MNQRIGWLMVCGMLVGASPSSADDALQLAFGSPIPMQGAAPTFTSAFTINSADDKVGFVSAWSVASEAISSVCFRHSLRTGTPVQHRISIQGIDTSGLPDGTIKGGGSPAVGAFTPPASTAWDATLQCVTLSNTYTPARGEILALVIEPCPNATAPCSGAATPDGSNSSAYTPAANLMTTSSPGIPYYLTKTDGGAWTKSSSTGTPLYAYVTASRTVGYPVQGWTQTSTYNTGTEHGMVCQFPAAYGSTFTIRGVRYAGRTPTAGTDIVVKLYSGGGASDTTVLQDVTYDSDAVSAAAGNNRYHEFYFNESTLTTLTWGNSYRVSIGTSGAGANLNLNYIEVGDSAQLTAYPGGTSCAATTRTSGNWTDTTTRRPVIDLILEETTKPSGGGGHGIIGG